MLYVKNHNTPEPTVASSKCFFLYNQQSKTQRYQAANVTIEKLEFGTLGRKKSQLISEKADNEFSAE